MPVCVENFDISLVKSMLIELLNEKPEPNYFMHFIQLITLFLNKEENMLMKKLVFFIIMIFRNVKKILNHIFYFVFFY